MPRTPLNRGSKRLNPAKKTAKSNKKSVYKGGNKAQGKTNSKVPTGFNKQGIRAKQVKRAMKTGRRT